ncbi:hypothetical protein YPPY59_3497, partial [Yersinia pestis PY-59]
MHRTSINDFDKYLSMRAT